MYITEQSVKPMNWGRGGARRNREQAGWARTERPNNEGARDKTLGKENRVGSNFFPWEVRSEHSRAELRPGHSLQADCGCKQWHRFPSVLWTGREGFQEAAPGSPGSQSPQSWQNAKSTCWGATVKFEVWGAPNGFSLQGTIN